MSFRIIIIMMIILLKLSLAIACADRFIGIIEKNEKNCQINRKGSITPCTDGAFLYDGDLLLTDISLNAMKIRWAPYANARKVTNSKGYLIRFDPPKDKNIYDKLVDFMGFVKAEHRMVYGSTRAIGLEYKFTIPNNSTLLLNQEVIVVAQKGATNVDVYDHVGALVWSGKVDPNRKVIFVPSKIGLIEKQVYFIKNGNKNNDLIKITMISSLNQNNIEAQLNEINCKTENKVDMLLQKSMLLQMVSYYYPDDYDCYFNSILFLNDIDTKGLSSEQKAIVNAIYKMYELRLNSNI